MSHRAPGGSVAQRAKAIATSALAWHDARPRASLDEIRGWWWAALIAASLVWMSNPLVYIVNFYLALDDAIRWTAIVVVISLPWLRLPRVPWPWLMFLGLCVASQAWSVNDVQTDISIRIYLEMTVLAVLVAANCRAEVVGWGLAVGGVVIAGLSLYAFHEERPGSYYLVAGADGEIYNAMAGIGTNENILAYTLVISLAATLALGRPLRRASCVAWFTALGVQGYGIYVAHSGTGYQTTVALLLVGGSVALGPRLVPGRRRRRFVLIGASLSGAVAVSVVVVSTLLGLEITTFSGRSEFWRATVAVTLDRAPVLGSGWGAVWEHPWDPTPPNPVAADIYLRAGYALSHGHNFFVDVLPELGLLGAAVALLLVAYAIVEVRRCGLRDGGSNPLAGRLVLMVLVALLVSGITEPMLTVPVGWWALALVVAVSRQRELSPRTAPGRHARGAAHAREATQSAPLTAQDAGRSVADSVVSS